MLYVFYVETGTMLSLDMKLTMEDAQAVKVAIQTITGIPVGMQVLLASGGECLESTDKICTYSAGTDTNPIYLFTTSATVPAPSFDNFPDYDMKEEVDMALNLPPTIHTVNLRCQLAQQICEQARHICRICDKLVHEQHLQQQGWAAVLANLEDYRASFNRACECYDVFFNQYLNTRREYLDIIESFHEDIRTLSEIPILPSLAANESEFYLPNEVIEGLKNDKIEESVPGQSTHEEPENRSLISEQRRQTLLDWIAEKDRQYSVEYVAIECRRCLEQLNENAISDLLNEMRSVREIANATEYREIKGLEERLFGLDTLKAETAKLQQEQADLAQAFLQNQSRACNLGDTSILPDLCASHKKQLLVMLANHNRLRDIKRRCINAKHELVLNLHHRIKWITHVQNSMQSTGSSLYMSYGELKRTNTVLSILQQIHLAPNAYMNAVSEVVRRRAFSQVFLMWANDIACQLSAIYSEEVARRNDFHSNFEGHFLNYLFPGLEDMPPPFAIQPPQPFDDFLPQLNKEDIESLKMEVPRLSLLLSVPDTSSFTQFFMNSSANLKPEPPNPTASIEDRIVEAVTAAGLSSTLDPALLQPAAEFSQSMAQSATTTTQPISSDRGFESETDTEEFEKVGQSSSDNEKLREINREKETVPEESERVRVETEELKTRLDRMRVTVGEAVSDLKCDFEQIKQWFLFERNQLLCLVSQLQEACSIQQEFLKKEIQEKEKALEKLNKSREKMKRELDNLREEKKDLIKEIKKLDASMKPEGDRKCRSTTRSVSESQLVSTEIKGPRLDIKDHDAIVARLKEQLTQERERAVQEERIRCEARLNQELTQALIKADADKQALFNESIRRFFDKKFETMRSLSQDFEPKSNLGDPSSLSDNKLDLSFFRMTDVSAEKSILPKLDVAKSMFSSSSPKGGRKEGSPSSSIVTIESNQSLVRDAATSPEPSPRKSRVPKEKLSESTNSLIQQGKITVGTCNEGDIVLVIWDDYYTAYVILQELTSHLYFLHHESLCSLGLRANPRKKYIIGEVVNKEFCQAKKAENRYNVPVGSRFYRVRVRPLQVKSQG